jgi:chemotaxis protein histidine kinase CheA
MATEAKTAQQAEQQAEQEAEERAKADAEMVDKTLKCLDSMSKRMDAFEAKMDADDKARRDAEEKEKEEKADAAGGDNPETVYTKADSVRVRHDNAAAQERADKVCNEWGTLAPRPLDGEAPRDYRVRLLGEFKQNSPVWRDVDMAQIARLPAEVFNRAESQIYADSMAASAHPVVPDGELRTVSRRMKGDVTGRMETVSFGRPSAWMSQFAHRKMRGRINPFPNRGDR